MGAVNEKIAELLADFLNAVTNPASISSANLLINDTMLTIANELWKYFRLIAIGLTLVYFLLEMNRKWALEGADLNFKSFFSPFLKLMVAMAVLSAGTKIMSLIVGMNNSFVKWAEEYTPTGTGGMPVLGDAIYQAFDGAGIFVIAFIVMTPLLLMVLVTIILSLVFIYKALLYKLEFLFRIGFTPIALADIYSGFNSNAIRWLKGCLAFGLYGMSFILIPKLGTVLIAGEITNWADGILEVSENNIYVLAAGASIWSIIKLFATFLVVPFAELGMLNVAKQVSKEVLG